MESSAKPKPKARPKSVSGPVVAPVPLVDPADAAELTSQQECLICMDQPVSVLLAPCGHAVVCSRCAKKYYGDNVCLAVEGNMHCPLCRELITATVKTI